MTENLIKIDFTTLTPLKLADKVVLRDIYQTLVVKGAVSENTKYSHWAAQKLRHYRENIDYFTSVKKNTRKNSRGASKVTDHIVTVKRAMAIIGDGHQEVGVKMREFFADCLELYIESQSNDLPDLLDAAAKMLREEKALRIQAEKDRAKIGDKKTATAMATASVAVRQLKKTEKEKEQLLEQIGDATNWKSAVAWAKKYPQLNSFVKNESALGRMLSKVSRENGLEVRSITDQRWGQVKSYCHKAVLKILEIHG